MVKFQILTSIQGPYRAPSVKLPLIRGIRGKNKAKKRQIWGKHDAKKGQYKNNRKYLATLRGVLYILLFRNNSL